MRITDIRETTLPIGSGIRNAHQHVLDPRQGPEPAFQQAGIFFCRLVAARGAPNDGPDHGEQPTDLAPVLKKIGLLPAPAPVELLAGSRSLCAHRCCLLPLPHHKQAPAGLALTFG